MITLLPPSRQIHGPDLYVTFVAEIGTRKHRLLCVIRRPKAQRWDDEDEDIAAATGALYGYARRTIEEEEGK